MVSPPPGVVSGVSAPPIASARPRDRASPSPTPVSLSRSPRRWNGRKTRSRSADRDARAAVDDPHLDGPGVLAGGDHRRLVRAGCSAARCDSRLTRIRSSRAGSACTSGRSSGMWTATAAPGRARGRPAPWRRPRRRSIGCGATPSAPACSRLMSSRFSTSRTSRSRDSSAVASSSSRSSLARRCTSWLRRLVTAALAEASGVRRSWLTADEQRGAQPVGLGEGLGGGGLLGQALLAQRDGGLGGERLDHPPVGGGERMPAQHQGEVVVDRDRRRRPASGPGTAGRRPRPRSARQSGSRCSVRAGRRVGAALQQGDPGEAERLPQLVEQGRQRSGAAQHAAGQGGQGLGLGAGLRPPPGCAARPGRRSTLTATRDGEEHDQGEDVLALGDGEPVDRRGEVVVEQQRADDRGEQRRVQAADQRDHRPPRRGRAGCRWAATGPRAARPAAR